MRNGVLIFDNVLIVRRTDTGWFCDVPAHPRLRFITTVQIAPATSMPSEGARGRVVITAAAARDLGVGGGYAPASG